MPGKSKYPIRRQPDDITCGPTCLHSIYHYYSDEMDLDAVIRQVPSLKGGGTLGALLGIHALKRGYKVWIYTYNLDVFDPTWFGLPKATMIEKLKLQMKVKKKAKFQVASKAYIDFLRHGGEIKFHDLSADLVSAYLLQGIPILTGLSATYLYKTEREYGKYPVPDDIRGEPQGHFVVLTSYDPDENAVTVADPYDPQSMSYGQTYRISTEHLISAILLGVVTYDGNLIVITKK